MDRGAWQATVYGVAKSQTHNSHTRTHTHTGKESEKEYIYVNHFAVHLKWCNSTILQLKNK